MPPTDLGPTRPLAPPLYAAAVYALPDLDALDAVSDGHAPGYIYARDKHPNADSLAAELAALEGGSWGVVCGSGMAALSAAFLSLVSAGDTVLASNWLYGRTSQLFKQQLARYGVTTHQVDVGDLDAVRAAVAEHRPKVVYAETLSNPLCRTADLAALAEIAHAAGARLVVDNTFATPAVCRPLDLGADLVMESLTKLLGGHSDVVLGLLAGRDADLRSTVTNVVTVWGLLGGAFGCWQAERGLATFGLRARAAVANAAALADWLADKPGVVRVVYPGRPDHPDYDLARRQFPAGCGHMLCVELTGGRDGVNRFLRAAPSVPLCPSLGHTTTTVSYPWGASHRFVPAAEKEREGITAGLLRVSAGCEPFEQLRDEVAKGLAAV